MRSDKPLKEIALSKVEADNRHQYLINEEEGMAIKIPAKTYEALTKLRGSEDHGQVGGLLADILAMAIAYRRSSDVSNPLNYWSEWPASYYPEDEVTRNFSKFLHTMFRSPQLALLTAADQDSIVDFFAKCPHGYRVPDNLVWAHSEFKPIIT